MEVNAVFIKTKRTELNWTQQQLADACDVSLRTIQRVERYGKTSNETLMALASVFEVNQQLLLVTQEAVEVIEVSEISVRLILIISTISLLLGVVMGATGMFYGLK